MAHKKTATPSSEKKYFEFPCIVFKQGDFKLVSFVGKASILWNLLEINRRIEDKEEGYQRALSSSRARAIARYIERGKPIPLSILATFDYAELSENNKILRVPNQRDAGWVIDGQHRLAGAHESGRDILLPVIAFIELDIPEQIQQFVTINKEAKGVPSSLYYDLLKHIPNKKPAEMAKERAADIATDLKRDEESPFYGKIVITTAPKRGELSLTNFVRKVTSLIYEGKGIFASFTETEQRGIISNYYLGLKNVFPLHFSRSDSIFFQTLGFGALMNALPNFFSLCLNHFSGFTVEDTTKAFKEVSHFDFDDWYKKGTGNAVEIEAGNDLTTELTRAFETHDDKSGALRL